MICRVASVPNWREECLFWRGALISQEASFYSFWELMGSWLKVIRQAPNRLWCCVLLAAKLEGLTACCECDLCARLALFRSMSGQEDVFNVKGWGEMVTIEAKEWMAPCYANGFGNSVEPVEEFADWEHRSPGCYLSPASTIRTSQCREWNSGFTSFFFLLVVVRDCPRDYCWYYYGLFNQQIYNGSYLKMCMNQQTTDAKEVLAP